MIGMARLRRRAHTRNADAWWARLREDGAPWIRRYRAHGGLDIDPATTAA